MELTTAPSYQSAKIKRNKHKKEADKYTFRTESESWASDPSAELQCICNAAGRAISLTSSYNEFVGPAQQISSEKISSASGVMIRCDFASFWWLQCGRSRDSVEAAQCVCR